MAEFKRLSDVEVVAEPTESANVLIEEDGIIKKAPKTAVGGAGGGEIADMVITVTQTSNLNIDVTSDNCSITEGSMNAVFAAIRSGRAPVIKVRYMLDLNAYTATVADYPAVAYTYGESLWLKYIATTYSSRSSWFGCYLALNPDGGFGNFISTELG